MVVRPSRFQRPSQVGVTMSGPKHAHPDTPITNKIIDDADDCPETRVVFLIKHLANQCRAFERAQRAEALPNKSRFLDMLVECEVIPSAAISDSEGFDRGMTRGCAVRLYELLSMNNGEPK